MSKNKLPVQGKAVDKRKRVSSQTTQLPLQEPSTKDCLFCIKLRKFQTNSFKPLLQKALFSKYSSSQNYYYAKDITDILENESTSSVIFYRDLEVQIEEEEYFKRIYKPFEVRNKLDSLLEYYKYHIDMPRLYMKSICRTIYYFHDKKRRIQYENVKQMLGLEDEEEEPRVDDSQVKRKERDRLEVQKHSILKNVLSGLNNEKSFSIMKDVDIKKAVVGQQTFSLLKDEGVKKGQNLTKLKKLDNSVSMVWIQNMLQNIPVLDKLQNNLYIESFECSRYIVQKGDIDNIPDFLPTNSKTTSKSQNKLEKQLLIETKTTDKPTFEQINLKRKVLLPTKEVISENTSPFKNQFPASIKRTIIEDIIQKQKKENKSIIQKQEKLNVKQLDLDLLKKNAIQTILMQQPNSSRTSSITKGIQQNQVPKSILEQNYFSEFKKKFECYTDRQLSSQFQARPLSKCRNNNNLDLDTKLKQRRTISNHNTHSTISQLQVQKKLGQNLSPNLKFLLQPQQVTSRDKQPLFIGKLEHPTPLIKSESSQNKQQRTRSTDTIFSNNPSYNNKIEKKNYISPITDNVYINGVHKKVTPCQNKQQLPYSNSVNTYLDEMRSKMISPQQSINFAHSKKNSIASFRSEIVQQDRSKKNSLRPNRELQKPK